MIYLTVFKPTTAELAPLAALDQPSNPHNSPYGFGGGGFETDYWYAIKDQFVSLIPAALEIKETLGKWVDNYAPGKVNWCSPAEKSAFTHQAPNDSRPAYVKDRFWVDVMCGLAVNDPAPHPPQAGHPCETETVMRTTQRYCVGSTAACGSR